MLKWHLCRYLFSYPNHMKPGLDLNPPCLEGLNVDQINPDELKTLSQTDSDLEELYVAEKNMQKRPVDHIRPGQTHCYWPDLNDYLNTF